MNRPRLSRRGFLAVGAAAGAGVAADRLASGRREETATARPADPLRDRIPFEGEHQAGVLTPPQDRAILVAFDAITTSRADLLAGIQALSDRARRLTAGHAALLGAPGEGPTPDSGVLGVEVPPDGLTVTIGFGASLFDRRFGLARRRPAALRPMPVFPDDALVASETHGDVLVQLGAHSEETVINALRDLMRATRGTLAVRWKVDGFQPQKEREPGAGRNLLGFKDGTSNPDVRDAALMRRLVFDDAGGTVAVVRIIRNRVEFWDRVARSEQELMIGRDKASGRKLPDMPEDAHIKLARPGTRDTEDQRILRRGYNYSRGVDMAGQLDMGLVFVAFNRDPERQFERIQARLAGEALTDYVKPTGGGYFYLPAGAQGGDDWVGSSLLA